MNKTANRQVICEVLMEQAETDKDIVIRSATKICAKRSRYF